MANYEIALLAISKGSLTVFRHFTFLSRYQVTKNAAKRLETVKYTFLWFANDRQKYIRFVTFY